MSYPTGPGPIPPGQVVPYINCSLPPYKIIADGATDQTVALQTALTAASALGATVLLPLGGVVVNASGVTVPAGVSIIGQGNQNKFISQPTNGSWIISPTASYNTGSTAVITLNGNNYMANFQVWGAGTDGFGGGTSRPNFQMAGQQVRMLNVGSLNGNMGVYCVYQGVLVATECTFSCNANGVMNCVDSQFVNCYHSSNACHLQLQSGASSNAWTNCRFEFNGSNAGVQIGFGAPTGTVNTSSGTASGTTLTFTGGTGAITTGYQVYNQTHPTSIATGIYVVSKTGTTVTLSAAVASAVSSGDTIEFYDPNTDLLTFTGCQFDRDFQNAIYMQYAKHVVITGCGFRRSGAGATANTSGDAYIQIDHSNLVVIVGNTMYTGVADDGSGTYSPSWGVWNGGANYQCLAANNTIVWNPVNGTNGGGINDATNFPNFSANNIAVQANTQNKFLP